MKRAPVVFGVLFLCLTSTLAPVRSQEPNTAYGSLKVNGFDDQSYPLSLSLNVNVISLAINGHPSLPFILGQGPVNPGTILTGAGQLLDIGTPPMHADISYLMNGIAPQSLFDLLAHTNAAGQMSLTFATDVSTLPQGPLTTLQALILDPSVPDGFELTAATTLLGPTVLCGTPIAAVGDDSAHPVVFLNFPFPFYGSVYSVCYVGSNGFVTFGAGSTDFTETNAEMNGTQPRIAPLWNDWSPNQGGYVSVYQDASVFRVCWTNVRSFGGIDSNTFRAELQADGTIQLSYGTVQMQGNPFDGIAGISAGAALGTNPSPINLSTCLGVGCAAASTKDPRFENFAQSPAGFDLQDLNVSFAPTTVAPVDGPYVVY